MPEILNNPLPDFHCFELEASLYISENQPEKKNDEILKVLDVGCDY
jgi:hypothetical protein